VPPLLVMDSENLVLCYLARCTVIIASGLIVTNKIIIVNKLTYSGIEALAELS